MSPGVRSALAVLAALALAGACGPGAAGQPPAPAPAARLGAVLVADPAHRDLVLFGGRTRGRVEGDTWLWSGNRWRRLAPAAAPPPRSFASAAADGRGGVILFGGDPSDPVGPHDDTWRWDGARWTELHPRTVPDGGAFRALAAGPDGAPVLVVALAGGAVRTWRWDGTDWVPLAGAPPWRDEAGLVPDRAGRRLLQVGGIPEQSLRSGDTWAWDGTAWAPLHPPHAPAGGPVATAELAAGPLLYEQDGTWTWSGGDWTLAQPPGQPRWVPFGALAAVPGTAGQALLLTGAAGDAGQTWLWTGRRWRPS